MVNKLNGLAFDLRQLFFSLLLIYSFQCCAQRISKHYISSVQEKGTLYFILPQKGYENKKLNSDLIYDITYSSNSDSIVMNFSYFDKLERNIDSLVLWYPNQKVVVKVKKMFIENYKSKWVYRYTLKVLFSDIENFFKQKNNPEIGIVLKGGYIPLKIKQKKWTTQSEILLKIFTLIRYNK